MNNILQTGQARVFAKPAGKTLCTDYRYLPCIAPGALEHSKGDTNRVYCPSSSQYDTFDVIANFNVGETAPSITFTGLLTARDSILEEMRKDDCAYDLQIHYGECWSPSDFDKVDKMLFLHNARITSYSTTELGTLTPEGRAPITESATLTMSEITTFTKPSLIFERINDDNDGDNGPIVSSTLICPDNLICECRTDACTQRLVLQYRTNEGAPISQCPVLFHSSECGTFRSFELNDLPSVTEGSSINIESDGNYLYIIAKDNTLNSQLFIYDLASIYTENPILQCWDNVSLGNNTFYKAINTSRGILFIGTASIFVSVSGSECIIESYTTSGLYLNASQDNDGNILLLGNDSVLCNLQDIELPVSANWLAGYLHDSDSMIVSNNLGQTYYTCNKGNTWNELNLEGCVHDIKESNGILYAIINYQTNSDILYSMNQGLTWGSLTDDIYLGSQSLNGVHLKKLNVCNDEILATGSVDIDNQCSVQIDIEFNNPGVMIYT